MKTFTLNSFFFWTTHLHQIRIIYFVFIFAKLTQNSTRKLTYVFWDISFVLFTLQVQIIHENVIIIFFPKMTFLLSQPHHLQIFTRLPLPSIHQPPWTTNLKLLMHLKSIYTSFSQLLWTKKNISFIFSPYSSKKTQEFDSKSFMVHRAIEAYDSWWVTFVWDSGCLGKTYVCETSYLTGWNYEINFFSRSVRPNDFRASLLAVNNLHGSLLVNADVSFAIDF